MPISRQLSTGCFFQRVKIIYPKNMKNHLIVTALRWEPTLTAPRYSQCRVPNRVRGRRLDVASAAIASSSGPHGYLPSLLLRDAIRSDHAGRDCSYGACLTPAVISEKRINVRTACRRPAVDHRTLIQGRRALGPERLRAVMRPVRDLRMMDLH
jgi:hypothetical protein